MKISIIGCGYVGLISAACLASFGYEVVCIDRNLERIKMLRQRHVPFHEPGLRRLLEDVANAERLRFSTDISVGVRQCAVVFIAVGTPSRRGDARTDLSDVRAAVESIVPALEPGCVVVMKSTVPVGTADDMDSLIAKLRPELKVDVVSNPEFLRQGEAIKDFIHPDRVVVGTTSDRARVIMETLYHPFIQNEIPILFTDRRTAELSKYATNAFLAAKIAMIGEIADMCEASDADVETVAQVLGGDKRIAPGCLRPGPGYGGSCFPKDTRALVSMAREFGLRCRTIEAVIEANEMRKKNMATRIIHAAGGDVRGREIGVLGVTFKPETDDMREAPSLEILPLLQAAGARIRAYDPKGMAQAAKLLANVAWKKNCRDALDGAHIAVVLTEWKEFRSLDFLSLRNIMAGDVLVDLRNIYRAEDIIKAGFQYFSIGRRSRKANPSVNLDPR